MAGSLGVNGGHCEDEKLNTTALVQLPLWAQAMLTLVPVQLKEKSLSEYCWWYEKTGTNKRLFGRVKAFYSY